MSALRDILVETPQQPPFVNSHTPTFDISEPPRKRPRVNQACETCRERKTRCDGHQPICKACDKRGVGSSCSYIRSKRTSINESQPSQHSSPTRSTEIKTFEAGGFAAINRPFGTPAKKTEEEAPRSLLAGTRLSDSVDRPSSVTALFRSISDEAKDINGGAAHRQIPQWRPTYSQQQPTSAEPERLPSASSLPPVLPRRRDADNYVQCYWECIHPLYPILHRPTFMKVYDRLWAPDEGAHQNDFDESLFMATANLVFAIGSRFSHIVADEHKNHTADDFYQRSRKSFCYDILDLGTPAAVQMLLLHVVYLLSTNMASRCWNTLGLAVRAAQTIGLHEVPTTRLSQLQIEMRRRIWHTCVTLDRMCSFTFQRPEAVHKNSLPLPSLIDDEYLRDDGTGVQPLGKDSFLSLFVHSCRIFDDLFDLLIMPHKSADAPSLRGLLDYALLVERRTHDLETTLPDRLRSASSHYISGPARLQQYLLDSRLRLVRLLAVKPLLYFNAQHGVTMTREQIAPIDEDLLVKFCTQAVHDAQKIIVPAYAHLAEGFLQDAWHVTHVISATLLALLAALNSPNTGISDTSIEHAWIQGIQVLEQHTSQVHSAVDAIKALQGLRQHVLVRRGYCSRDASMYTTGPGTSMALNPELLEMCTNSDPSTISLLQHFSDLSWLGVGRRPKSA